MLGFGTGPLEAKEIEQRALERMEAIRPHQIRHPELVTEGMNQLAQAFVELLREAQEEKPDLYEQGVEPGGEPEKPDTSVSLEPEPPKKVPFEPVFPTVDFEAATPGIPKSAEIEPIVEAEVIEQPQGYTLEPEPPKAPVSLPLEPEPARPESPVEVPLAKPKPAKRPDRAPPDLPVAALLPMEDGYLPPTKRRVAYRQMAAVRRLQRAWLQLRDCLSDPFEPLAGPWEVAIFLEATAELRSVLHRSCLDADFFHEEGQSIRFLAMQPDPLGVLREFLPSQRLVLAADWAAGLTFIEVRSASIRRYLRMTRRQPSPAQKFFRQCCRLISVPETLLILLTGAIFWLVSFKP